MSWTKRQLVQTAYEEIGISSAYDITAEMYQSALRRLDSIMATFNADGVLIGYPLSSNPDTADLNQSSNLPDYANQCVYTALAVALAPTIGRAVSPQLLATSNHSYKTLISRNIKPLPRASNPMITGAGNDQTGRVFSPETEQTRPDTLDDVEY